MVIKAIKLSQAASYFRWLKADGTNVFRTISVLVLRELKWPGIQSVAYIHLPRPSAGQVYIGHGLDPRPLQFPEDDNRGGSQNTGFISF
jgi:hypothetical protein